ncbi:MAG: UDP-N-acetylmuramoyl-tripeptide--D-alanyl-D-alanine ligase [Pseudoalteromonas tetraodonis]
MKSLTLGAIADFSGGAITQGKLTDRVSSITKDTRSMQGGELYVALVGENFDGHDYVQQAAELGAAAVLVQRAPPTKLPASCAVIHVDDTLRALQSLARRYRLHLSITAVGITGSNGKTSTKDFVAAILSQEFEVTKTQGNLNNHIGLPLSILAADERHECGIWEMGMSNPGEIEKLAAIAQPDVGVITNIGVAHLEFMKTRDAIAKEKGMLVEMIGERGIVILPAEDDYAASIARRTVAKVVMCGFEKGEIRAVDVKISGDRSTFTIVTEDEGEVSTSIGVPGKHMVSNALLAAAVGLHMGLSLQQIARGLETAELTGGRLQLKRVCGIDFIDDSYNANPDSVRAALQTLVGLECEGKRFALLGGMAELGEAAEEEHRKIGKEAAAAGVDYILSVGEMAVAITEGLSVDGGGAAKHFDNPEACAAFLKEHVNTGDLVLVKGSRSASMERVLTEYEKLSNA